MSFTQKCLLIEVKMRKWFLFLLILVIGYASAEDDSNGQHHRIIEVSGVGSVLSVPDRFSFSLSIEQKGGVASELNTAIVERTNTVVQALIKIGIDKKAVQSLQVQFNPWVEYNGNTREQKGFILTRQVKVTLKTLTQYEKSIDAVLSLGVNNINEFIFTNSQADAHYQEALKHALLNAKQRAMDMANVLDLKLAGVISISEQSTGGVAPISLGVRQLQASESYQPGEMSTQARVKVIFALKDSYK
ncbi:SIMPL domain-containing protein [Paraglaciecola sp. MB-3u-78]|uniref:SIMPL domain-containing protein n=1 Tax=Paraglaciecola sp. MB-3u-78 TaxID=2058332 RepID=UPI001E4641BF|nr:SIMPL domain-containing protein [Paraglaciecola sp. MB-3u-78]